MKKFEFNQEDKDKIKEAVANLEKVTAGELVIYFARNSDTYPGAGWKFSTIVGGSMAIFIGILSYLWLMPSWLDPMFISILIFSVMVVSIILVAFIPKLKLAMVSDHTIDQRTLTKARDIFLEEEVFKTADRIGILLFISELEHKVVVLGDTEINAKISKKDWTHIVDTIVLGIKHGHVATGIANAIGICQDLLLDHGFINVEKADNELSDEIRIED